MTLPTPERRFFLDWPSLLASFISLYYRLIKFRSLNYPFELNEPRILVTWHSEEVTLLPHFGFTQGNIMISSSKDGDILAKVAKKFGYKVSRGSSHKGAVGALLSLKRSIKNGDNIVFAVDGPRGPRHQAKPGAVYLAAKTGHPICPVGVAVSRAYVFEKSWSKSRLPLPGAKVVAYWGPLLRFAKEDLDGSQESQCQKLTEALEEARTNAEKELENWLGSCKKER